MLHMTKGISRRSINTRTSTRSKSRSSTRIILAAAAATTTQQASASSGNGNGSSHIAAFSSLSLQGATTSTGIFRFNPRSSSRSGGTFMKDEQQIVNTSFHGDLFQSRTGVGAGAGAGVGAFGSRQSYSLKRSSGSRRFSSKSNGNDNDNGVDNDNDSRKMDMAQTPLEEGMTKDALAITNAAIQAVNPTTAIQSHLSYSPESNTLQLLDRSRSETETETSTISHNMNNFKKIYIASFGKAATAMALATAQIVAPSNLPTQGMVITKDDHATPEQMVELSQSHNIDVHFASHPIPDQRSVDHSRQLIDDLRNVNMEDGNGNGNCNSTLIINCISGGGSAAFCSPIPPLGLEHMSQLNSQLLACGMPITEMNIIRKKVEIGKGGGLVYDLAGAGAGANAGAGTPSCTYMTMVLSDVIGDPLDLIASGPTVKDKSTYADAWNLVERYGLEEEGKFSLLSETLDVLRNGRDIEANDNANDNANENQNQEADDARVVNSDTVLVGNNALAVTAAAQEAERLGYNPVILGTTIEGEAAHIANVYVSMAEQLQKSASASSTSSFPIASLPAALIAGGETTVTLSPENTGLGGRNQEIGLAAALKLKNCGLRNIVLASIGTDGTDGPTDAAGAVVDGGIIDRIEFYANEHEHEHEHKHLQSGEDALRDHDSYTFLDRSKDEYSGLIKTGATGTNVADVCVTLIK